MTSLTDIIVNRITREGPISVADYMAMCLLHPEHGYYTQTQPFGATGDFVTAPEISQMFGEMVGLCLAQAWMDQGAPSDFCLAEIGPGRGTLMSDILRATHAVNGFHKAAEITLVEASDQLVKVQRETLKHRPANWVTNTSSLPDKPLFLIANEFFDCLPIRQFKRTDHGWQEQMIGAQNGELHFALGRAQPVGLYGDHPLGTLIELSPASIAIGAEIGRRIEQFSGAAILIDYGRWGNSGDTLQAVKSHQKVDPLTHSGQADLTAHVDFQALAKACDAHHSGLTAQGVLLERLGITQRAQTLAQSLTDDALENHIAAHHRLTHPEEMGTLFQALAIVPTGAPLPAGFDPCP